jgi:hypothetical protein
MSDCSLGPQKSPHRPTHVFSTRFELTVSTQKELSGRSPINPDQARLTSEFFEDGLPEVANLLV